MKFIDMHCDTIAAIYEARRKGQQAELKENTGRIDVAKLKKGECFGQNFALFTQLQREKADPFGYGEALLRVFREELEKNSGEIRQAFSLSDMRENERRGLMSAILTVEEGGIFGGRTELLEKFYDAGCRMLTLTWNFENELAYPNRIDLGTGTFVPETERGLKPKGVEFVERMNELGMAVDVSHLGDAGFWDVLSVSKQPVAASHSNARAVTPHVRNLTDEMIRALSEGGGVIGINYCPSFLGKEQWGRKDGGRTMISDMVRHISHIYQVGGIECLGLGSDFDGIPGSGEVETPAELCRLEEALLAAGFSGGEIEKIFWKNVFRFYGDIWNES